MKKTVVLMMLLTIVSKVIGFLRDVTLAYFYGTSGVSDAYLISLTVPVVLFGMVAKGVSTGYIPMISRLETEKGPQAVVRFTNNLIWMLLLGSTVLIGAAWIFAEPLVLVFASGFTGETLELAVYFTRVTLVGIYFTIFIRILSAYLNYQQLFAVPNLLGIPMSLIVITSIVLSAEFDMPELLAYGFVAALFVQWLILLGFSFAKKFKWKLVLDPKDPELRKMAVLALPVILGSSVQQINKLVDRTLASQVTVGGISALNYAHTLTNFVHGVFVISITTVMFPSISKQAAGGKKKSFRSTIEQGFLGTAMLTIPASAAVLVLAEPIVRLLFDRGAFDAEAVTLTSGAFFFYALGMTGTGLRVVLSQSFYALQDTRTPMINAAIAMGVNIVLNFLLAPVMGISGLALATSISAVFCAVLLYMQLQKQVDLRLGRLVRSLVLITAASAVMAFAAGSLYTTLAPLTEIGALSAAAAVGAVLYFLILYVCKFETLLRAVDGIRRRVANRRQDP
ncbi:murein biosynthesis integral membrane protein MurJ [Alkalicoccus urumqiensis]|uniref:Probable lipid II flippase MurJ n=1 Tax=Alkalicoccus urumqiensis TaxID=1548213 RepID=A0A2P6MGE0_ALKUR|nr:murein biosynthesis integral membrane protein MurJ [Alkalicoccus urumqiensis]PRO65337.1 murein biosynthesis integral membrane protein MurJ [Alkalicoccus urumqiensis]